MLSSLFHMTLREDTFGEKKKSYSQTTWLNLLRNIFQDSSLVGNPHSSVSSLSPRCMVTWLHPPQSSMHSPELWHWSVPFLSYVTDVMVYHLCACMRVHVYHNTCRNIEIIKYSFMSYKLCMYLYRYIQHFINFLTYWLFIINIVFNTAYLY